MEVTLKKAADLSRAAIEAANAIKVNPTVNISIYTPRPAREIIEAGKEQLNTAIVSFTELLTVGYAIRSLIKERNSSSGIDGKLGTRAFLDAQERRLTQIMTLAGASNSYGEDDLSDDVATVEAQIAAHKNATSTYTTTVGASLLDSNLLENIRQALNLIKRQKADLRDELASLNLTTKIVIPQENVDILEKYKILV